MAWGRTIQEAPCLHYWGRKPSLGLLLFAVAFAAPPSAMADPIKAGVEVDVSGGYARLVFTMSEMTHASVRPAGNVLIVSFNKPALCLRRPPRRASAGLYQRGAARSRRQGHSLGAGAQGDGQFHDRRREIFRRSVAGHDGAGRRRACRRTWSRSWRAARARPSGSSAAAPDGAAEEDRAGARACRDPADFHALRVRCAGQTSVSADRGKDRLTLTFDAPITIRSRRCRGGAAGARSRRSIPKLEELRRWSASASSPKSMCARSATRRATSSTLSAPTPSRTKTASRR